MPSLTVFNPLHLSVEPTRATRAPNFNGGRPVLESTGIEPNHPSSFFLRSLPAGRDASPKRLSSSLLPAYFASGRFAGSSLQLRRDAGRIMRRSGRAIRPTRMAR
jgi:hypothetical protein